MSIIRPAPERIARVTVDSPAAISGQTNSVSVRPFKQLFRPTLTRGRADLARRRIVISQITTDKKNRSYESNRKTMSGLINDHENNNVFHWHAIK